MRLLAFSWFLIVAPQLSAQVATSIAKRKACTPALFTDFSVSLAEVGDSNALASAILKYQPVDTYPPFVVTFDRDGRLDSLWQQFDSTSPTGQNQPLLQELRAAFHESPPDARPLRASLRRLPGIDPAQFTIEPAILTCQPEILDAKGLLARLVSGLFDLRNDHSRQTPTYPRLSFDFIVEPDSSISHITILLSSNFPHVDSMAFAVFSRARYAPAVAGRRLVPLRARQGISFTVRQ